MHTIETQLEFDFMKPAQMDLKLDYSSDMWTSTSLHDTPSCNVIFYNAANKVVGELSWNEGPMKFKGDAEESAQLFFDSIIKRYIQAQLDLKNENGWKS